MKKNIVVATVVFAVGLMASPAVVSARGATFEDNDVNPPRDGLIIEDVMQPRQDTGGGREQDIDVFNPGSASKGGRGADVNHD